MTEKDKLPSLEQLGEDLEKAKLLHEHAHNKPKDEGSGIGDAMRVSVELVAGVGIGGMLGYWMDKWLDTSPIFLFICFVLGVAGSMMNIYRHLSDDEEEKS